MTGRVSFLIVSLCAVPLTALAQTKAAEPAPAAPSANPISASQAKMYTMLSGVVVAAAEKMPEENYSFKPTPEVRSFGQLVGHLADSQYFFCALAAGETKSGGGIEKTKTSKADLVAALKDAVAYCNKAFDNMTDTKGSQMVKFMNFDIAKLTMF